MGELFLFDTIKHSGLIQSIAAVALHELLRIFVTFVINELLSLVITIR